MLFSATEAPKKSKKKSKDYDKKAQQLAASSDFDAYIDKTVSFTCVCVH